MSDSKELSRREIYYAALALPPEQRDAYVADHCSDADIRDQLLHLLSGQTETVVGGSGSAKKQSPTLPVGIRLGHYIIQRPLGSGGMGFVYEALDENLNRTVAVKVLPVSSYDEASRKRFWREAEAASALNHANIVTVYAVGREGEVDFIAMELVSGQTLQKVLDGKAIATRKAIGIASQIADALAAAHEAGIVHRDLKPANVMVNDRGIVKVLDFGLAKTFFTSGGPDDHSLIGQIVGTVSYMSPEQAEGKAVDARSDIFAFGSVLYEMLTGRRPFQRPTSMATMAAIISADPEPIRKLMPGVPRLLESILTKCLQKNPYERWQSLADVKMMLQDLAAEPDAAGLTKTSRNWIWYAAALVTVVAGLAVLWQRTSRAPALPPGDSLRMVTAEKGLATTPTLSKDGSLLAFASDRSGQGDLDIWMQQAVGGEPLRLTSDPSDETDPSFSPDGSRIAFRSEKDGGGIYLIPVLGGDPVLLVHKGRNPRFSPDGKSIAYWIGRHGSVLPGSSKAYVLDLAGGAPRELGTELSWTQFPVWSPDGASLIVKGRKAGAVDSATEEWWAAPAAGGAAKDVGLKKVAAQWAPRDFHPNLIDWYSDENGSFGLFSHESGDNSNLYRVRLSSSGKAEGKPIPLTHGPGRQVLAHVSRFREGSARIAFNDETVNIDVWRLPVHPSTGLSQGPLQQLTDRLTPDMNPSISGDGGQLYYISSRLGSWSLIRKDLDTRRERILSSASKILYNSRVATFGSKLFFSSLPADIDMIPVSGGVLEKLCSRCGSVTGVSPKGDRVLYEPAKDEHLLMLDVASRQTTKLADRGGPGVLLDNGQFSPDGKWVAFQMNRSKLMESEINIIPITGPLPVPEEQWIRIGGTSDKNRDPVWAPSASVLYFTSEQDGFRCIWAQRLNPVTRAKEGEPFPLQHFHTARLALRSRASSGNIIGMSAGGNQLVFALTETKGNIWLEETNRVK